MRNVRRALGLLLALSPAAGQRLSASPAVITDVSTEGVGYVTYTSTSDGISGQIGRWDTPYPNPDTGAPAPGLEPQGPSTLRVGVDVNDGGKVSFNYDLKTYDAGIYDWFDVSVETPTGTESLVSHLGKPGTAYGTFFRTPAVAQIVSLDRWRNQHISFVFTVEQDGWGDQTAADLYAFDLRSCPPPLAPLADSLSLSFEAGNTIYEGPPFKLLSQRMCLSSSAAQAGVATRLTSAYRPSPYQGHLREVWDRWQDVVRVRDGQCSELRSEVEAEMAKHALLRQPAGPGGPHTTGDAFDMVLNPDGSTDALAKSCNLWRRLMATDPVHFELLPH